MMIQAALEWLKKDGSGGSELVGCDNIENIIASLKNLAKKYTKINNELVDTIWKIDLELNSDKLKQDLEALRKQRVLLNQKVLDGDYSRKINELIALIQQLEIQAYGVSKVAGNSPYRL